MMEHLTEDEVLMLDTALEIFKAAPEMRQIAFIAQLRRTPGLDEMADLFVRIMKDREARDAA